VRVVPFYRGGETLDYKSSDWGGPLPAGGGGGVSTVQHSIIVLVLKLTRRLIKNSRASDHIIVVPFPSMALATLLSTRPSAIYAGAGVVSKPLTTLSNHASFRSRNSCASRFPLIKNPYV
jgi:hypothetical protein